MTEDPTRAPRDHDPRQVQQTAAEPDTAGVGERPAEPSDGVLVCEDVVAGYVPGVPILNGCNLVLGEGELVGIVGPNGAGKSTLV